MGGGLLEPTHAWAHRGQHVDTHLLCPLMTGPSG